MEGKSSSI